MKKIKYTGAILVLLIFSVGVSAQDETVELEDIFGQPFRTLCVVNPNSGSVRSCRTYNFNDEYEIGIGNGKDREVLNVYLYPKTYIEEMDNPISADEQRDFLKKAAQIRSFGSLRFSGRSSMKWVFDADVWEIYDNAYILYAYPKREGKDFGLAAIMVFFPIKVRGHVSSVEKYSVGTKGEQIFKVNIDGYNYLTTDGSFKVGAVNTLMVVNP